MFFPVVFEFVDFSNRYDLGLSKPKGNPKKIIILLQKRELSIKSNAKAIAFASAVKIEEPSGIRKLM